MIIVKFWLQISAEEQLKRFEDRQNDPLRRWKITEEDWRNRDKAEQYHVAAEEMFERTDHHLAPWDVISGEQKRLARVLVLETAIERVEQGMVRWGMAVPATDDLRVDELMTPVPTCRAHRGLPATTSRRATR